MKKVIMLGLVCFIAGYSSYPFVNDIEYDQVLNDRGQTEDDEKEHSAVVRVERDSVKLNTESSGLNTALGLPLSTKEKIAGADKAGEMRQVETLANEELLGESIIVVQEQLEEWAVAHKNRIDELIESRMSSETADHMKLEVSKDNEFLSQPQVKQDPVEDDSWAYDMEQQLKLLISQHASSGEFELLDLVCKQLVCDIIGIVKESNTWFNLYVVLLQNVTNVEFPDGNNAPKSVIYMENDVTIVYSQLRFKGV